MKLLPAIRPESIEDHHAIYNLTKRAFAPMPFAGGNEQDVINALRQNNALSLSLVAVHNGVIVGHVAFSPASNDDGSLDWYRLGPIAVEPDRQRRGIGSALITEGFRILRERKARGCIVVGDPNYYSRHGLVPSPHLAPKAEPAEYFMIRVFEGDAPHQRFAFHGLFYD
jgi:putative acetyltransferase